MRIQSDPDFGFRALTVRQPYASQIASGAKPIEYRSWSTDYRGDLLITASARSEDGTGPVACAICVVELAEIRIGRSEYHWILRNPRKVPHVKVKGKLQLWTVDEALARRLGVEI